MRLLWASASCETDTELKLFHAKTMVCCNTGLNFKKSIVLKIFHMIQFISSSHFWSASEDDFTEHGGSHMLMNYSVSYSTNTISSEYHVLISSRTFKVFLL